LCVGVAGLTEGDRQYMEKNTGTKSAKTGVELVNVANSWSALQGYDGAINRYLAAHPAREPMSIGVYAPANDIQLIVTPQGKGLASTIQRLVPAGVVQIRTEQKGPTVVPLPGKVVPQGWVVDLEESGGIQVKLFITC
jgi:hypothetical protein